MGAKGKVYVRNTQPTNQPTILRSHTIQNFLRWRSLSERRRLLTPKVSSIFDICVSVSDLKSSSNSRRNSSSSPHCCMASSQSITSDMVYTRTFVSFLFLFHTPFNYTERPMNAIVTERLFVPFNFFHSTNCSNNVNTNSQAASQQQIRKRSIFSLEEEGSC